MHGWLHEFSFMLSTMFVRANQVASSPCLLEQIGQIQLQQLSSLTRRELLRTLVLVGATTDSTALQEQMYLMV